MFAIPELQQLVQALAQLDPAERSRVLAEAARRARPEPRPAAFTLPIIKGGTEWIGGSLRREELYGDDGR